MRTQDRPGSENCGMLVATTVQQGSLHAIATAIVCQHAWHMECLLSRATQHFLGSRTLAQGLLGSGLYSSETVGTLRLCRGQCRLDWLVEPGSSAGKSQDVKRKQGQVEFPRATFCLRRDDST